MKSTEDISADFPFRPNFVEVHGSEIHYVDEGKGDPILFLHGNPTSSYLWRNVIPHLSSLGRCIAPDLIGMGRSDKPALEYRFFDHVKYVEGFIDVLGLKNITLVIHDWGSGLGFHYAMRHEDNVRGVAFMEAVLRPWTWEMFPKDFKMAFRFFRTPVVGWFMIVFLNMFVEKLLPGAVVRKLTEEEMNRYREPFRSRSSRKTILRWPNEIPINGRPADVHEAVSSYSERLKQSELPKLLFYAHPGGIVREDGVKWCKENLKNLKLVDIGEGIHFLQEDNPHLIGKRKGDNES
jgi:haloalkane dehalogenase